MKLGELPPEMFLMISIYVELHEFTNISVVNKKFGDVFKEHYFWKSVFERDLKKYYCLEEGKDEEEYDYKNLCKDILSITPDRSKVMAGIHKRTKKMSEKMKGRSVSYMNPNYASPDANKLKNYQKDDVFEFCGVCGSVNTVLFLYNRYELGGSVYETWDAKCLDCHMVMDISERDGKQSVDLF